MSTSVIRRSSVVPTYICIYQAPFGNIGANPISNNHVSSLPFAPIIAIAYKYPCWLGPTDPLHCSKPRISTSSIFIHRLILPFTPPYSALKGRPELRSSHCPARCVRVFLFASMCTVLAYTELPRRVCVCANDACESYGSGCYAASDGANPMVALQAIL